MRLPFHYRPVALVRVVLAMLAMLAASIALTACRDAAPRVGATPPASEFVVAAGDSSFWVSSGARGVQVRGAPLELARVDGRFYELYVVDEDLSYEDADLVGQRVYRRDLLTGDSLLVFADTLVPHLARQYARLHPDDERLAPDDEPSADPRWRAMTTLDLGEVSGPFVSYEEHTDVERDDAAFWHTSRRGVLDLRSSRPALLADVAGAAAGDVEARRAEALRVALDSVRAGRGARGSRAARMLSFYHMDPGSFALATVNGAPAIAYALPGAGDGDAGHLLPLSPIAFAEPAWWHAVVPGLPVSSADGTRDVWRHGALQVLARYDSVGDAGTLILRDSTAREWTVARIPAPATHIFWLDAPPLDERGHEALARAFEESAMYGETVRTAARRARPPGARRLLRSASFRQHASGRAGSHSASCSHASLCQNPAGL